MTTTTELPGGSDAGQGETPPEERPEGAGTSEPGSSDKAAVKPGQNPFERGKRAQANVYARQLEEAFGVSSIEALKERIAKSRTTDDDDTSSDEHEVSAEAPKLSAATRKQLQELKRQVRESASAREESTRKLESIGAQNRALQELILGKALEAELAKARAHASAVPRLARDLMRQVRVEIEDGRAEIVVVDERGEVTDLQIADLVQAVRKSDSYAFEALSPAGAGSRPASSSGAGNGIPGALSPAHTAEGVLQRLTRAGVK